MSESFSGQTPDVPDREPEGQASPAQIRALLRGMEKITEGIGLSFSTTPSVKFEDGSAIPPTEKGRRYICFPVSENSKASYNQTVNRFGVSTVVKLESSMYESKRFRVLRVERLDTEESPGGELESNYSRYPELYLDGEAHHTEVQIVQLWDHAAKDPELRAALREFSNWYTPSREAVLTESRYDNLFYTLAQLKPERALILEGSRINFDAFFGDEE